MREQSVAELVDHALREHAAADRTALTGTFGEVSYRELADRVDRAATTIHGWAARPGEVLGIAAPKTPDTVVAFLAALRAGLCVCFLEPRLGAAATADRIRRFGITRVAVGSSDGDERSGEYAVPPEVSVPLPGLAGGSTSPPHWPGVRDDALMLFTSGSTGTPKAIRLTHANLVCNAEGVLARTGLTPDDVLLHIMPLHHTNGLNNQLIAPLLAGAAIALVQRFDAAALPEQLRRHAPTVVTGVPTMYLRALPHLPADYSPGRLRFLRCGSAPITPAQQERIEAAFGVPLVLSYGLSEATCTSTMNPPDAPRPGSVGTVLDGQRVGVFSPNGTTELPVGEEGEVRIAGPTLMTGYVGGEDNPVENGWLHTGDLGRVDADGYLTISGRIKDVIIRGGENIAPGAVEDVLAKHAGVAQCAVVAADHADLGQVPRAFVVAAAPESPPSEAELRELVRTELARPYVPDRVAYLPELPLNRVGKIDRNALRDLAADES